MGNYRFHQYTSSAFNMDPAFKNKDFEMYGDASAYNAPILFETDGYRYVITKPYEMCDDKKLMYRIATYLFHHPKVAECKRITYFFGDINDCKEISSEFSNQIKKSVSIEMLDEWFPTNITEINNRVVDYFLSQQKHYGQEFEWTNNNKNLLLFIDPTMDIGAQNKEYSFITQQIFRKGLLIKTANADNRIWFTISEEAIEQFQKTKENSKDNKLAFIAIKFGGNEERIQAIQKAIALSGYEPRIMNEYETNNWIMPEIFHQIKLAKFVVVDLSIRCDGAYYEAGYAYALGKEVIHIYDKREEKNNPLHFDVAQISTVIYNDYEELVDKLINRIHATID